jgi:acyl-CoA thioester hydrolase
VESPSRVEAPRYLLTRRVQVSELDERAHVNNVVYVQWVQDVAAAHWVALAPAGARDQIAWVALRHEIDYLKPAVLGDEIIIATWVGVADGLSFERFTEIRRRTDERVLARARTLWCPVDARTGRPRRVSAEVRARCSVPLSGETNDE